MFAIVGTFDCVQIDDGRTEVTHSYEFEFRRRFRWLELRIASPLADAIDQEVTKLAELVADRPAAAGERR